MGDSSASYINMVQHLIEKCSIFHMTKEKCMEALSKHANITPVHHLIEKCLIVHTTEEKCMEALSKYANITPVITSTVWNELKKTNKEFFEAYARSQGKEDRMPDAEKKTSESDSSKDSDD